MQVEAKTKLKQIIIEPDEMQNKGKMTIEGDIIIGGLSLFGGRPFSIKLAISEEFAVYIKKEIETQVGKIMESKINGAE